MFDNFAKNWIEKSSYSLIFILSSVVLFVVSLILVLLYVILLDQKTQQMEVAAKSQASLIEAVARFDSIYSDRDVSGGFREATLMQIRESHTHYHGFGKTGEFTLARLTSANKIEYVLEHRNESSDTRKSKANGSGIVKPEQLVLGGTNAIAMQQALQGLSGSIVAKDYRGVAVLAAYEPLPKLGLGIVVKMDMHEIRLPFIQAAVISLFLAGLLILIGTTFIKKVTNPIVANIRERELQLTTLLESSGEPVFCIDNNGICTFVNAACISVLGYESASQLIGHNAHELFHHSHLDGACYHKEECPIMLALRREEAIYRDDDNYWRADGQPIAVEYRSNPIIEGGKVTGAVIGFNDISERRALDKEKAQLVHDMGERIKELACVYAINQVVTKHTTIKALLQESVRLIPQGWHYPQDTRAKIEFSGEVFCSEPFEETDWSQSCDLVISQQVYGRISIFYLKKYPELDEGPFLSQERKLLENISKALSEAIQRIQAQNKLEHMATHDALTGLVNRQTLPKVIESEILRAGRYKHKLSIVLLDLDHFKQVNDTYGHLNGDIVLKHFATILKQEIRDVDIAVRFGGEEFLLVLPETPVNEARILAERILTSISSKSINLMGGEQLSITCSIGIATYPDHTTNSRALFSLADEALYSAKESGRNQVVLSSG